MKPLFSALCVAAVLGSAAHAEITLRHAQGETTLQAPPQKVLILDINALDIADAMGAKPAAVLSSNLPDYLAHYAQELPSVGTIFEPDYEAIAAQNADLMVVGTRTGPAFKEMSAILPTVDLSLGEDLFGAVAQNIRTLGQVFAKESRAEAMVAELEGKVAHLKAEAPKAGTALILVTNGGKLGAYGPASRVGWLHSALGFQPVEQGIDDRFHGGDVISFEYILEKNPDWIFVIDRDAGVGTEAKSAKAVLDNALMAETKAVQAGHVVYLDPHAAYIAFGGYTALGRLLDQMSAALAKG